MHDPKAMTAIDAATDDLAGLESYGSDLALTQAVERKAAATNQKPAQAPEPALLQDPMATSGESPESTMPIEVGNIATVVKPRTAAAPTEVTSLPVCSNTITDHCTQHRAASIKPARK